MGLHHLLRGLVSSMWVGVYFEYHADLMLAKLQKGK